MIVTCDKDNNIFYGNLVVENEKELKEFRDYLMKDSIDHGSQLGNYRLVLEEDRTVFRDIYLGGTYRDRSYLVINRELQDQTDPDICTYNKKVFYSYYVNSVLIFTSLLGAIDKGSYGFLAKSFIEQGIFRYDSFDKIWCTCSNELLKKGKLRDLKAFRAALEESVIRYDVVQEISNGASKNTGLIKNFSFQQFNELKCNSDLLLGEQSFTRRKVLH